MSDIVGKARQRIGYCGLTMAGEVLIIKAMFLPLRLLISSVFTPSKRVLLELEGVVFYFLWGPSGND